PPTPVPHETPPTHRRHCPAASVDHAEPLAPAASGLPSVPASPPVCAAASPPSTTSAIPASALVASEASAGPGGLPPASAAPSLPVVPPPVSGLSLPPVEPLPQAQQRTMVPVSECRSNTPSLLTPTAERGYRRSSDARALTPIDRQEDAGDELGLIGREEQRRIGDVPRRAHLATERHHGVAGSNELVLLDAASLRDVLD